jgi:glycosidase/PKD repeat protein
MGVVLPREVDQIQPTTAHFRVHPAVIKALFVASLFSVVVAVRAAQFPSPSDWRDENIYFIFTDRFNDGDLSNDNVESAHGNPYSPADPHAIHGGDFRGIQQKLDYIKSLGATAIWVTPIPYNVGGSAYHGYGAQDFNLLAPHLGSMTDMSNMVQAAHARGIKVILDIVCNHSGDLIDSGDSGYPAFLAPPAGYNMRYKDTTQQHAPPFNITNATPPTFTSIFHNNGGIDTYSLTQHVVLGELDSLDDFATETTYVRTNMMNIYTNWVGIGDFDGFRIDTVKHVDYGFWQYWCPKLHQFGTSIGKSNFFMFGEIFNANLTDDPFVGSYTGTMAGGPFMLDSTLDYVLYGTINSVFATASGPTQQIETHYNQIAADYATNAWYRLVTFLDNHDNARFLSPGNASDNTNRLSVALEFLYTSRGIPCLYYGTEQAFDGTTDPNNREDMFAGQFEQGPSLGDNFNETHPLFELVAKLNNFRRRYQSLRRGVHNNLSSDPSGPGLFAYSRVFSNEEVFVTFNTADFDETLTNCATTYAPGTVLVNLLNTNETIIVTTAAGTNTTPSILVPSMTAKAFIAQSLLQPLDPTVVSQSPSHANTNVSVVTPLVLGFSKPMNTNSVQAAFSTIPAKSGVFTWSTLHDTMTFTPSAPGWAPLTTNLIHLATNAVDSINGLALYAPFDTYFFTLPDVAITGAIVTGGNGNGLVDPNECNFLNLIVANIGGKTDTTVNAILTTTTPGVTITQPLSTYPDLLPGIPATNSTPFKFGTSSPFACGTPVSLSLALTYTGGTNNVNFVIPASASTYNLTQSNGVSIVPGTTDTGNHVDDGTTTISLPFSYTFYGRAFNTVTLSSNGNLQFLSTDNNYANSCLPYNGFNYAIIPCWQDLYTGGGSGQGIFTSISGSAPNRIFNIEWRANPCCSSGAPTLDFEIRLYENQVRFDIIYGAINGNGATATVGIQKDTGSVFSQFECATGELTSGLMLTYQIPCTDGGGTCPSVASFTGAPTSGPSPLPVTFTDTSIGVITNRFWNFGDNTTVNTTTNVLVHTYSPGTYNVTLAVTGPGLVSTNTKLAYITALSGFQVWQIQYFGSTNNPLAQAAADPDSDGYTDLQEYSSGTNPTNSASHPTGFPPNLLAWWKFDEGTGKTASDSSLNSNTGTLTGGGWSSGLFGQAFNDINGTSQVNVANSASLNPTNAITISAWVYDNSGGWYTWPRIVEKGASDNQYALFANPSGQLEFLLAGVTNGTLVTSPPSSGAWHHLAGTYDGSLISLYIDGQLAVQQSASGLLPISADALAIGGRPSGNLLYQFNGLIDEARIYGRALSASEIIQLYNTDSVGDGIANWWRLQYFGNGSSTGATTCATCDYDGTGQNNFFKFVAGLDPTDPTSIFFLQIAGVTNQALSETLTFLPLALGRTYTPQFSTDLVSGTWLPLTLYTGPLTNANQVTITDTNATVPQKFYRLHITWP